jgi:hypothetical protein
LMHYERCESEINQLGVSVVASIEVKD